MDKFSFLKEDLHFIEEKRFDSFHHLFSYKDTSFGHSRQLIESPWKGLPKWFRELYLRAKEEVFIRDSIRKELGVENNH